jgi:hypothetical protein
VDDAEDLLGGLLGMRHLQGEGAGAGDGFEEEARGGPGGEAELARLEDNVALAAALLEELLHGVGDEGHGDAGTGAHAQPVLRHAHAQGAAEQVARACIEERAEGGEFAGIELFVEKHRGSRTPAGWYARHGYTALLASEAAMARNVSPGHSRRCHRACDVRAYGLR